MSPQLMAALVMFIITVSAASIFWWPMTRFPRKNSLVNFYWAGFWTFLALIAAISGAQATLTIMGQDVSRFSAAVLGALTLTFVIFVVFAWARLALKGVQTLASKSAK